MSAVSEVELDATGMRLGLVVSRYHREVTDALSAAAVEVFTRAGGAAEDLLTVPVPGAFELTAVALALARRAEIQGVVALGCIIRGETNHDRHIAAAVAQGLARIAIDTGKAVGFGVLTCHTRHQARARAGGEHGNKGAEAMSALIETVRTLQALGEDRAKVAPP